MLRPHPMNRLFLALALTAGFTGFAWGQTTATSPVRIDLVSVYQAALANNADLAAARAQFQATQEAVPQARAGLLPQLGAEAEIASTRTEVDTSAGEEQFTRSGMRYQANLSQPLFNAERWFQLQAAQALSDQARYEFALAQQSLIQQTADAYFSVLSSQDNLAASRAEESAFKRQLDQANERFEVGLSDRTDVLEAQAGFDTARANRMIAERQVADAFQALYTLTNQEYVALEGLEHGLPVLPPIPNDASAWVETAAQQNLNLLAANEAVEAAEETVRQRRAGHAPTVDAVASYQRGDNDSLGFSNAGTTASLGFVPRYDGEVEQASIGVQLSIPLYRGGLTRSQTREAFYLLDQAEQQRESLRRQVVENTRNLHRAVNTDVEQVQARLQSIISSRSALEATEIGYQVGTRNIVDVLDAQRRLYAAVRDYNDARYSYILDNLRLKQAAGTLNPEDLTNLSDFLDPDYNPDTDFLPDDLPRLDDSIRATTN